DFSVSGSLASETETPSLTSAAACFRFAGVMRFIVPISSSLPQRPQFDRSFFHCSYWAVVTLWSVDPRVCESMVLNPTATIAGSTQNATVSLLVIDPSSCGGLYGRGARRSTIPRPGAGLPSSVRTRPEMAVTRDAGDW